MSRSHNRPPFLGCGLAIAAAGALVVSAVASQEPHCEGVQTVTAHAGQDVYGVVYNGVKVEKGDYVDIRELVTVGSKTEGHGMLWDKDNAIRVTRGADKHVVPLSEALQDGDKVQMPKTCS